MWAGDNTYLNQVRIRGLRKADAAAQLRASHVLASASLRPPAMPPNGLLVIRVMRDP
jgi:hypothetical protein